MAPTPLPFSQTQDKSQLDAISPCVVYQRIPDIVTWFPEAVKVWYNYGSS